MRKAFTLAGATHVDMQHNIRKNAFTLAEVLITLGIIGIVAALTMPGLIANHKEKETVTKLRKVYSSIQQAFLKNYAEQGAP
ncbi:MAG: type II secretion system GspH family protein, partial [Heliobacteriaceae bacterium]|nr:type II secretion system GspH family protein [Heliobacteriaceae bacterium]